MQKGVLRAWTPTRWLCAGDSSITSWTSASCTRRRPVAGPRRRRRRHPGISLHLELQRLVAAGFTPLEALQTATINPARFFGKMSDSGSVQAGRFADLVILRANPLDDIVNTRTIAGVVADGRYWPPIEIERLREQLKQVAAER
jgi:predicted amidohydrolase YtcJ